MTVETSKFRPLFVFRAYKYLVETLYTVLALKQMIVTGSMHTVTVGLLLTVARDVLLNLKRCSRTPPLVRTLRAADDMDALTQLVVLCVCGATRAQPLGEALRLRSDYGVYASKFSREYEPVMFAAIPLHAPVPVLRVLSRMPLMPRDRNHAPSVHHPVYARPPYTNSEYTSSVHSDYETSYEPQQYASTHYAVGPYANNYQSSQLYAAASSTPEKPTILYARPNPHGGYTYHKQPNKLSAKRAPAPPSDSPYIIRVHKYRIVKDR